MKITTTDGKEYYISENCPYCYPNTAGQHDSNCPMFQKPYQNITNIRIFKYDNQGNLIGEIGG